MALFLEIAKCGYNSILDVRRLEAKKHYESQAKSGTPIKHRLFGGGVYKCGTCRHGKRVEVEKLVHGHDHYIECDHLIIKRGDYIPEGWIEGYREKVK